jgi:hypothetical protein
MKRRILSIFSVTAILVAMMAVMTSCGNKKTEIGDKSVMMPVDTAGLAQFQAWKAQQNQLALATIAAPAKSVATSSPARRTVKSSAGTTKTGSMSTSTQYPAKTKPKGWSKAAKGAAIGAAGGAVAGAVINKRNRAVGAAIGGVAGGVIGYGVGRHMDKKDGRY